MVQPGQPAPPFTARDQAGDALSLEDLRGKRVVLWFYPKADTPGCTREGCGFRDYYSGYKEKGVEVLGISFDPPEANATFREAYAFPFRLLSDTDHAIAEAYGAFDPARPAHARRNTYVIGADGTLEQVLEGVDPGSHPKILYDAL